MQFCTKHNKYLLLLPRNGAASLKILIPTILLLILMIIAYWIICYHETFTQTFNYLFIDNQTKLTAEMQSILAEIEANQTKLIVDWTGFYSLKNMEWINWEKQEKKICKLNNNCIFTTLVYFSTFIICLRSLFRYLLISYIFSSLWWYSK